MDDALQSTRGHPPPTEAEREFRRKRRIMNGRSRAPHDSAKKRSDVRVGVSAEAEPDSSAPQAARRMPSAPGDGPRLVIAIARPEAVVPSPVGDAMAARRKEVPAFDVTAEDGRVDEPLVGLGATDQGNDVGHVADELVVGLADEPVDASDLVVCGGIETDRQDHAVAGPRGEDAQSAGGLVVGIAEDPFVADASLMKEPHPLGQESSERGAGSRPAHPDEVRTTDTLQMPQRCRHSQGLVLALDRRRPALDVKGEGAFGQMHEEVGGVPGFGRHLDVDSRAASKKPQSDGCFALGAALPLRTFVAFDESEEALETAMLHRVTAIGDALDQAGTQLTLELGQERALDLALRSSTAWTLVGLGSGSSNGTPLRSLHGAEFIRHARASRPESRPTYRSWRRSQTP